MISGSDATLQAMLHSVADEVWVVDKDGSVRFINDAVRKNLGVPPDRWPNISDAFKDLETLYPDGTPRPPERAPIPRALKGESLDKAEEIVRNIATGELRWREVSGGPIRDNDGSITGAVVVVRDITESKRAEDRLKELAHRYATVLESSTDCILFFNRDWTVTFINRRAEETLGMQNMTGKNIWVLFPEAVGSRFYDEYHRALAENVPVHFTEFYPPLGMWFEINAYPSPEGLAVYFRDVTERKRADDALRESEADLNRAQAVARTGSWRLDVRNDELLWSDEAYRIFGISRETPLTYERFLAAVHPEDRGLVDRSWAAALRGAPYDIEHRIIAEGTVKWVRERAQLEIDGTGTLIGGFGTVQDITERKRADDALRESEARLRATFDNAAVGIVEVDKEGRFLAVNDRVCRILGYTQEEMLGLSVRELTAPEDRQQSDLLNAQLNDGKRGIIDYEKRYLRKDGSPLWVHVTVSPVRDEQGGFLHAIGTIEDIDERKRAQSALQESEAKMQLIINRAPVLISYIDHKYQYKFINNSYEEWFGITKAECVDKPVAEVLGEKAFKKLRPYMEQALAGEMVTYEDWAPYQTGTRFIHASYVPDKDADGNVRGFVVLVADLTEREKLVQMLSESVSDANRSKAQLEAVFHAMQDGVVVFDMQGKAVLVNEAEAQICGYASAKEMEQDIDYFARVFELTTDDGRVVPVSEWPVSRVMRGESLVDVELRGHRKDTGQRWSFSYSGEPVYGTDGKPVLVVIITKDITARKAVEERARLFQERLAIAQSAASIGNWDTDVPSGKIWWSPETYLIYGIPEGTPITLDRFLTLVHPDDCEAVKMHTLKVRRGEGVYGIDHRIIRPDGEIRYVHEHGQMFFSPDGKPLRMVGIVQDITERKKAEEELRRTRESLEEAQRIAKLGSWENDLRTWALQWSPETYEIFGIPWGTPLDTDTFLAVVHPEDRQPLMELSIKARDGKAVFEMDHRIIRPDGEIRHVHEQARVMFEDGIPVRMVGTAQDITVRKRAEIALRESEDRYRTLFENSPSPMWEEDFSFVKQHLDGLLAQGVTDVREYLLGNRQALTECVGRVRILGVNQAAADFYGVAQKEDLFGNLNRFFDERAYELFCEELVSLQENSMFRSEFQARTVRGEERTVSMIVTLAHPDDWSRVIVSFFDITDHRKATQSLRESEERFRAMFSNAAVGMAMADVAQGRFIAVNETMASIVGCSPEDLVGKTYRDITHPDDLESNVALFQELLSGAIPFFSMEKRYVRVDGRTIWVEVTVSLVRDASGTPLHTVGIIEDVTERKRAGEALRESEERFRTMFNMAAVGMAHADSEGVLIAANKKLADITGYTVEELVGKPFSLITHPDDFNESAQRYHELWAGEETSFSIEKRYLRKDGRVVWGNTTVSIVRDARGVPLHTVAVIQDITERREIEQALRESEQLFRELADAMPQIVWSARPDGTVDYYNRRWYDFTGFDPALIGDASWAPLLHPDDLAWVSAAWQHSVKTGLPYQAELRYKVRDTGKYRWFLVRALAVRDSSGKIIRWFGTSTDIEDQKQAEQALRESEEKFKTMAETMPHIVWTAAPDGAVTYYNHQWEEYSGIKRKEGEGWGWKPVVHPDEEQATVDAWATAVRTGEPYYIEHRIRRHDGQFRWFVSHGVPLRDESGNITQWVGTATDIEYQKRATENLRFLAQLQDSAGHSLELHPRVEALARSCVPHFADCCFIDLLREDGTIERGATAAIDEKMAQAFDSLAQNNVMRFSDSPALTKLLADGKAQLFREVDDDLHRTLAPHPGHAELARSFGMRSIMVVPLIGRGKLIGVIIFATVGDRTYGDEDLVFAQDLAHRVAFAIDNSLLYANATAALALRDDFLSIASHELKTPVTSVKAFLQALEQRMRTPEKFDFPKNREYMQLSIKQVDRLASLVNDLLDINRINKGTMEYHFTVAALGPLIAEVVERMSVSFPTHRMVCKLQDLRSTVRIDPLRFEQALTNIITNAVKYSPAGSTIDIVTKSCGEYIAIDVTDRGIGISSEQQAHIFDPYYRTPGAITTRAGGLGVGLYISLQLIKAHSGMLSVKSVQNEGSTFTITLPCVGEC